MDTRRYILKEHVQDFPDVIDIPPVEEEIRDALRKYVAFGEELQCLEQLFEVFAYNLEQLDSYCTMYYDDQIMRKRDRKPATFIEINAHFINVISSGRTLMEATEKILGVLAGEDRKKAFTENCIRKKYDEVFAYRFFYFLRNYAQHGYLPVSRKADGKFCFDLAQILHTEHFHLKASMQKDMEGICGEIEENFNSEPYIAFTVTLDAYALTVVEIYFQFLKEIESDVHGIYHLQLKIINEYPELGMENHQGWENMILYDVEDTMIHLYNRKESLWNAFLEYKKYVLQKLKILRENHTEVETIAKKR